MIIRYLLVVSGVVSVQAAGVCPPTLTVAAAGKSVVAVQGRRGDLVPVTATCRALERVTHESETVEKEGWTIKVNVPGQSVTLEGKKRGATLMFRCEKT